MSKLYMADFETRAGEKAIEEGYTYVWAWCICDIMNPENIKTGSTISEFFHYCVSLGDCTIYFHNLKFDGRFILDYLFRIGYKFVEENPGYREFTSMISETGVWYAINVYLGPRRTLHFRDSLKKLPFTIKQIGKAFNTKAQKLEIDYVEDRPYGYQMTAEEEEYVKNDVLVAAEALKLQHEEGLSKMTIGSDCLNTFMNMMGGKKDFRIWFPVLSKDEDKFVRRSYKGGWCYLHRAGVYHEVEGSTYDVNSLYPSMMHSKSGNYYPFGPGIHYEGMYQTDPAHPLYVQKLRVWFTLKPGFLPTIQIKGNFHYEPNEWLSESDGMVELVMTNVDIELMFKHYDILDIEWIEGYKYQAVKGIFDPYIDRFMEMKKREKGAKRALSKLYLNNLYGQYAKRIERANKCPVFDEESRVVKFVSSDVHDAPGVYIPVGTFVTAYSRRFTITAAQNNYNSFIYADTDSIHCAGSVSGIDIDDKELCCWKHESSWSSAIFRRQKTYIEIVENDWAERVVSRETDEAEAAAQEMIKCAGMPVAAKISFLRDVAEGRRSLEDFDIGLVIPNGRLIPKAVRGGVILVPSDFSMKDHCFMY